MRKGARSSCCCTGAIIHISRRKDFPRKVRFLSVSELQYHEDGVDAMPCGLDAVDVGVRASTRLVREARPCRSGGGVPGAGFEARGTPSPRRWRLHETTPRRRRRRARRVDLWGLRVASRGVASRAQAPTTSWAALK